MTELSHLFSPITLGKCEIKNRVTISGHLHGFVGRDGMPTDRELRYHETRAKGGFGLIVMAAAAINHHSRLFPHVLKGSSDDIISWFKKYSERIHAHGAKLSIQAWHNGHQQTSAYGGGVGKSPSQIASAAVGEAPSAMTVAEIQQTVQDYADFAARCKEGGLDGMEIHAGHGYLPQQFLSPYANIRTDQYGGSLENRMRFSMEVIEAVRNVVGPDFMVGMRISADEMIPVGYNLEDMKEIAPIWAETGKIDYLSITGGVYRSAAPFIGSMALPPRPFVYFSAELREVVDIPVITAIRINDPVMANDIIKNGEADLVVMTRASICDPELPNKAKAGRLDDIRQCIACNEGCWEHAENQLPITCSQNPEVGREGVYKLEPTSTPKKVMVVGGGPAGMKAAAAAKERGHEVTLFEKSSELGGAILIPAKVPSRNDWNQCVRFLERDLKRVGVKVEMNTAVTSEMVTRSNPDVVIVATGANTQTSTAPEAVGPDAAIEIETGAHVVTAEDVIEGKVETGPKVVIADFQNYMKGLITADLLVDQDKDVTLVMPMAFRILNKNPYDIDIVTYGLQLLELTFKGVKRISEFEVKKVGSGTVTIRNIFTEMDQELEADTLVTSYWRSSDTTLFDALEGKVKELYKVGDCISPRRVIDAIHEGYKIGMEI